MNVEVRRSVYSFHSSIGHLAIDGVPQCVTLEPVSLTAGDDPNRKPRAIDPGVYPLTIRWSDKFQKHVPHVENVPHFVAIEIHVGNAPKDTEGCTCVGQEIGPGEDWIAHSLVAWTSLMAKFIAGATLRNPQERNEKLHVWDVGTITYTAI